MAKGNGKRKQFSESQKQKNKIRVLRRKYDRKVKLIQMSGGRCIKCGYNKNIRGLSFHHRDPDKKEFGLNINSLGRNWDSILKEFYKCDLLCLNCHAEVESERSIIDHGEFNNSMREEELLPPKLEKRKCRFCKMWFRPRDKNNNYCSKRCAKKDNKKVKKPSKKKFQHRINTSPELVIGKQREHSNGVCKKQSRKHRKV